MSKLSGLAAQPPARAVLLLGLALVIGCGDSVPPSPRNVLLIVVDTLRADHLGYAGYPRDVSPRIDELARDSMRFERAYASAGWTRPSIASILTGKHARSHGVSNVRDRLPGKILTLAETLGSRGFATAGVVSNIHLRKQVGFGQGFEHWDETNTQGELHISSDSVTDLAIEMLDDIAAEERPFFLFAHYFDPHYAYRDHPDSSFAPHGGDTWDGTESMAELRSQAEKTSAADRNFVIGLYDEEIRHTDTAIGRLLDRLDELGVDDETVIVFTSDHGEEFFEHGGIGHETVYEEILRVPLTVRAPGLEPGESAASVSLVSIAATVLTLLELPFKARQFDAPALDLRPAPTGPTRPIFAQSMLETVWIEPPYKLILSPRHRAELYNLDEDPLESKNLWRQRLGVGSKMKARLNRYKKSLRKPVALKVDLSPEVVEQLRRLGYADESQD